MGLDYNANLKAIQDIFIAANTTTATVDLSGGLSTRIDNLNIRVADIDTVSLRAQDFPLLFIRVSDKEESFETLGRTGLSRNTKSAVVRYDLVGMARKDGAHTTNDDLSTEVNQFAQNIEGVMRENDTLSGTALWANTPSTTFTGAFENGGIWIKGVLVNLEAKHFFK